MRKINKKGGYKMNYLKLKFTHYSLCYYANNKERKPDDCIIKISCYGHDKKVKQDLGGTALTIKFFKDDSEIPPNEHKRNFPGFKKEYGRVKRISLHYPISQFNDIISILRYEKKPLYFFIEEGEYKDSPKGGLLTEGLVEDDDKYEDVPIEYYK